MNIDNGNLQFNRYQTGTIGNARPENVAANNTQTASGNAALAQAQEGQTFTGRIVDVNGSQVTIQMDGNMMLQARMAEAVNLNMGDTIAFRKGEFRKHGDDSADCVGYAGDEGSDDL